MNLMGIAASGLAVGPVFAQGPQEPAATREAPPRFGGAGGTPEQEA